MIFFSMFRSFFLYFHILNTLSLNSNRQIKINFTGGNLSSDSGMLLIHEFAWKLGLENILTRIIHERIKMLMNNSGLL